MLVGFLYGGIDMVGVARWGVLYVVWGMAVSSVMVGYMLGWLGLGCWWCDWCGLLLCPCCVFLGELGGGVLLCRCVPLGGCRRLSVW